VTTSSRKDTSETCDFLYECYECGQPTEPFDVEAVTEGLPPRVLKDFRVRCPDCVNEFKPDGPDHLWCRACKKRIKVGSKADHIKSRRHQQCSPS